jgi:hypothetical protein
MRLSARNPEAVRQQRLERWRRDRAAASTLRDAFPKVERVRVDLVFESQSALTPSSQSHVLHPPARAHFEFPCPYADCDGQFALNTVVADAMAKSSRQATGSIECPGVRSREKAVKEPCLLRANYSVTAHYKTEGA